MMRRVMLAVLLLLWGGGAMAQERPADWRPPLPESVPNYREHWRNVVMELSNYAKGRNPKFVILMKTGAELLVRGDREEKWDQVQDPKGINFDKRLPLGAPFRPYLKAIDGVVFQNLYCGESALEAKPLDEQIRYRLADDVKIVQDQSFGIYRPLPTTEQGPYSLDPAKETARAAEIRRVADLEDHRRRVLRGINALRQFNRAVLSIENCPSPSTAAEAQKAADRDHVLSFVMPGDEKLDTLPKGRPLHENPYPVANLSQVKTWLPLFRGDQFGGRPEWLWAMGQTNYDALVIDVGWRGIDMFTKADIAKLKFKNLGGPRLVMAEMPMGRAFDWRWYWQKGWVAGNPPFLFAVDRSEPGSFVVDPLSPQWLEILGKYLAGLIDLGFDGVVMDDMDTYLWFEDLMPLDR